MGQRTIIVVDSIEGRRVFFLEFKPTSVQVRSCENADMDWFGKISGSSPSPVIHSPSQGIGVYRCEVRDRLIIFSDPTKVNVKIFNSIN